MSEYSHILVTVLGKNGRVSRYAVKVHTSLLSSEAFLDPTTKAAEVEISKLLSGKLGGAVVKVDEISGSLTVDPE